ncbi:PrsW family intramembrane metalloprotease [Clostridia bacterium]|nr:PrsW family intramembrane metalloprotease [Clostridia bacterium]
MNLMIAIAPAILVLYYIYQKDILAKEPPGTLLKLFIWGAFLVIPASILENSWYINPTGTDVIDYFMLSFFNVALIEEGLKYLVFIVFIWKGEKEFDEFFDGIVYAIFISLGFATIENIFYVTTFGTSTGIIRAITAIPLHAVCAVISGSYLSRAKFLNHASVNLVKAFIYPILLHGLYNFILFLNNPVMSTIVFPLLVISYYRLGLKNIKMLSGK